MSVANSVSPGCGAAPVSWFRPKWAAEADPEPSWPDDELVRECLAGNETAWTALIDKYKNLIFSVPVRWGFSQADASDVFQSVVAELLSHLNTLRNPNALAGWLIQIASHKCSRWQRDQAREAASEAGDQVADQSNPTPEGLLQESMREQILRDALAKASPRCRALIRMLFFENAARPYPEVAASLGIATGSVGFIRRRCLDRLRKYLVEAGLS